MAAGPCQRGYGRQSSAGHCRARGESMCCCAMHTISLALALWACRHMGKSDDYGLQPMRATPNCTHMIQKTHWQHSITLIVDGPTAEKCLVGRRPSPLHDLTVSDGAVTIMAASLLQRCAVQVYMCGPQLYMDTAATIVGTLGVPAAHLYQESFSF